MIEGQSQAENLAVASRVIASVSHFDHPAKAVQMLILAASLVDQSNGLDLNFPRMFREANDFIKEAKSRPTKAPLILPGLGGA